MTIKLYDKDQYLKEFDANIVNIVDNLIELDKTTFYAESGGQSGDIGTLNDKKVIYTKYTDDGKHIHVLEKEHEFKVGDSVHGIINWNHRYKIMKLHSAGHIMEHFLWKHFGNIKRIGSYVDNRKDRADYLYEGRLNPKILKNVEMDTNKFLSEGHPIIITVNEVGIRTWRCGPIEMQCAGTHVKNTLEINEITLKRKNPGRGVERIETSLK